LLEAISLDDTPSRIYDWALENLQQFDGLVITREAPLLPVLGAMQALGLVCGRDMDIVIKHSSQLPRYVREPLLTCFEDMHLAGLTLARCMLDRFNHSKQQPLRPHSHILFSPPALETTHDSH
jgi:LacI family transcriptional regulator